MKFKLLILIKLFLHRCTCCESDNALLSIESDENIASNEERILSCEECDNSFLSEDDLGDHNQKDHVVKCNRSTSRFSSSTDLDVHIQLVHKSPKVTVHRMENFIHCDKCEHKCLYNIQMKKHNQKFHPITNTMID